MALLELQKISFQAQQQMILRDISFSVTQGEFLSISGPSGGGKSTLLKVIASLLTATGGKLYFEGQEQGDFEKTTYRRLVSYCFQQPSLFGKTVKDNLVFPFELRNQDFNQEQVLSYLQQVALPESFLEKAITELSGGEKQRVALIRNLLFLPKVLLLDEVTAGLDEESKKIVQQLTKNVHQQGVTILQVSHDAEDLRQGSRQIVIEGGRLLDESISRE